MGLLPQSVVDQLPPLHTQDTLPDHELFVYARVVQPNMGLTWFVMELDSADRDTCSAYFMDATTESFGYFSFAYLEGLLPGALQCDTAFRPQPLFEAVLRERQLLNLKGNGLQLADTLAPHRAYYYAFTYSEPVKQKYTAVKQLIKSPVGVNLSAYHFPAGGYKPMPVIVVIGDRPSEAVHKQIMDMLQGGTPTTIDYTLLMELFRRHLRAGIAGGYQEWTSVVAIRRSSRRAKKGRQGK